MPSGGPVNLMPIDRDGSLIDSEGRLRQFGRPAFQKLASDLARCFVCGVDKGFVEFNDEHVIRDWILRRFGLHSGRVQLPNGAGQLYGRYTLRCCAPCNTLLGTEVETPVSRLFTKDLVSTFTNLNNSDLSHLYCWLCLIFIKICHLLTLKV